MTRAVPWGRLADGGEVQRFTLRDRVLEVDILSYGATIAAIRVPDRQGTPRNVVLGLPDLPAYVAAGGRLGAVVGRYANRIAGGTFTLDGETYRLSTNDGQNTLHGGSPGYDKRNWQVVAAEDRSLALALISPHGDQNFPGELAIEVRYALEDGTLAISYGARTDRPTVLNITNHAYFNLAGEDHPDILDHEIEIPAEHLVAIDKTGIPTGEFMAVAGTPFDFTERHRIGARIRAPHPQLLHGRGYDHCYILGDGPSASPRVAARLRDPISGRTLTVSTTEPGVQFYTGNSLNGSLVGSGGLVYRQSAGLALETQHFPDSPNRPDFPSTVLRPGETFRSTTLLHFGSGG